LDVTAAEWVVVVVRDADVCDDVVCDAGVMAWPWAWLAASAREPRVRPPTRPPMSAMAKIPAPVHLTARRQCSIPA
jgi:hypothetical protein